MTKQTIFSIDRATVLLTAVFCVTCVNSALFAEDTHNGIQFDRMLTDFVRSQIPSEYTDDKKWNKQVRQYDGIRFRREGWKLETKRKWKMVNHGTWQKYSIGLADPSKSFDVKLLNVKKSPRGTVEFEILFRAHVWLKARQSKWVRDIQIYSLSAEGEAKTELRVHCELALHADWKTLPPDLIFKPHVTKTQINVTDFKIHRVSKVGGEFAQQVTKATENWIAERKVKEEVKLVEKLNKQIAKKDGNLRLKIKDVTRNSFVDQFLPHIDQSIAKSIDSPKPSKASKYK